MSYQGRNWRSIQNQCDGDVEDKLIDTTFLSKCILYLCFSGVMIFFLHSCMIDKETLEQCRNSCGNTGRVEKVTAYKCICAPKYESIEANNSGAIWSLP